MAWQNPEIFCYTDDDNFSVFVSEASKRKQNKQII